jgi:hypothetical protein
VSDAAWEETLRRFAARLDAVEAALEGSGEATVPPFQPPAGLGPPPAGLRGRAAELLARAETLDAAVVAAMNRIASHRRAARSLGTRRARPVPTLLDRSA